MQIAWVMGAGLLARGFVAPLLHRQYLTYFFDPSISRRMALDDRWFPVIWENDIQWIGPVVCGDPSQAQDCREPDLIVTCVGPNGFHSLRDTLVELSPTAPILTLENDPEAAQKLRYWGLHAHSGVASVTIPDPGDWLYQFHRGAVLGDSLGMLYAPLEFLDETGLRSNVHVPIHSYTDHKMVWLQKRFLHLAPHALCAYIGISRGYEYIHEVMQDMYKEIDAAVLPLVTRLTQLYGDNHVWEKAWNVEKARFSNAHTPDSVYRVGRNPRLKLSKGERLKIGLFVAGGPLWEEAFSTAVKLGYGDKFEDVVNNLPASPECVSRIKEYETRMLVPEEFRAYFPEA